MKPVLTVLALLAAAAHGQLVITEVMPSSSHPSKTAPAPDADGDWWELTNVGTKVVDLTGYTWDDTPTPEAPTVSRFPAGVKIQPGESIIILEEPAENVSTWRAVWGLTTSTQVIDRTRFTNEGGEGFSGLGSGGDEVNLYDAGGKTVAHVAFGVSTKGRSLAFQRDGTPIYGLTSFGGKQGAVNSKLNPADCGSPGEAGLHFTTAPVKYGKSGYRYEMTAVRSGASVPVITATHLPSFLSLGTSVGGKAVLSNNRPLGLADAGEYLVQVTATSDGVSTMQEYLVTILNPLPSVILNEYNAVSPSNFLNGGSLTTDDDGGVASVDRYFGRVAGNGGQWAEFVVLGNGGTGPLDMRGWSVEIGTNTGYGFLAKNKLVLSGHADWQAVPSGTILTFIDKNTAHGGLDSGFALRDNHATTGDIWTNIWMGDATHLTYTSLTVNGYTTGSGLVNGILIDNNNTQFRVKNSLGQIVFGPAGEGVAPLSGTNSKEVFELEGNPTPSVSPFVVATATTDGYDDGASESTFGLPNNWFDGTAVVAQRFTDLTAPEIGVEQPVNASLAEGATKSFGSVATGASGSLTFTIRNSGTSLLSGVGVTLDGTAAADFSITANPATSVSAPDGTTTFTVKFAPKTAGAKTAALHIVSNDEDEAVVNLTLTGTAFVNVPEIVVQQPAGSDLVDGATKKSFGTLVIGKTGTAKAFTIKNIGQANLTGLVLTKDGKQAKDFIITSPGKAVLAPGQSTTFKVKFKPTAAGVRNAAIHLKSNDANESPFDIKLTGTGAKKK